MTDLRSLMNTFDRNYIVAMFQSQNLQKTYRLSHEKARSKQYCHCGSQAGYLDLF